MSNKRIIERIKKCLRLAESTSDHEAAVAMRQAQRLMERHGLTMTDINLSDVGEAKGLKYNAKRLPGYLALLAGMISDVFGCEIVLEIRGSKGWKWETEPVFFGINPAPELAQYAYDTLARQLMRSRREYMKKRRCGTRTADLYAQGWVAGARKLTQKLVITEEKKALIADYRNGKAGFSDSELQNTKARYHSPTRRDVRAVSDGMIDGKEAQIHAGVNGSERAQIGH